ncbi:hypothetical protein [Massilia sp.]|uniref:hypothetical protein n=1 Tax=Massilia sp. TaxID=1882437 RepID=UPI0028A811CB|nr:hypothetical protein [Massilia sp.]
METNLRPTLAKPAVAGVSISSNAVAAPSTGGADGAGAPERTASAREQALAAQLAAQARPAPAPSRRGLANWDTRLQGHVASAQQALDYLDRVSSQLESVKAALSAKLANLKSGARDLEARARQLSATIAARSSQAGGAVDAELRFSDGAPARQRFRIGGLDLDTLQASAPVSLAFSVGGAGGPQLAAAIEAGMTPEQIAARLDRTLAPVKVRANLDERGRLEFSTEEANWPAVRDSIAISGRGRAGTEAVAPQSKLEGIGDIVGNDGGNADALRQSLREVVQALERVRRSQAAASAALSAATQRAVQPRMSPEDLAITAQDFASTAASHDYESLLAITSALVGVSRERVLALLGLR